MRLSLSPFVLACLTLAAGAAGCKPASPTRSPELHDCWTPERDETPAHTACARDMSLQTDRARSRAALTALRFPATTSDEPTPLVVVAPPERIEPLRAALKTTGDAPLYRVVSGAVPRDRSRGRGHEIASLIAAEYGADAVVWAGEGDDWILTVSTPALARWYGPAWIEIPLPRLDTHIAAEKEFQTRVRAGLDFAAGLRAHERGLIAAARRRLEAATVLPPLAHLWRSFMIAWCDQHLDRVDADAVARFKELRESAKFAADTAFDARWLEAIGPAVHGIYAGGPVRAARGSHDIGGQRGEFLQSLHAYLDLASAPLANLRFSPCVVWDPPDPQAAETLAATLTRSGHRGLAALVQVRGIDPKSNPTAHAQRMSSILAHLDASHDNEAWTHRLVLDGTFASTRWLDRRYTPTAALQASLDAALERDLSRALRDARPGADTDLRAYVRRLNNSQVSTATFLEVLTTIVDSGARDFDLANVATSIADASLPPDFVSLLINYLLTRDQLVRNVRFTAATLHHLESVMRARTGAPRSDVAAIVEAFDAILIALSSGPSAVVARLEELDRRLAPVESSTPAFMRALKRGGGAADTLVLYAPAIKLATMGLLAAAHAGQGEDEKARSEAVRALWDAEYLLAELLAPHVSAAQLRALRRPIESGVLAFISRTAGSDDSAALSARFVQDLVDLDVGADPAHEGERWLVLLELFLRDAGLIIAPEYPDLFPPKERALLLDAAQRRARQLVERWAPKAGTIGRHALHIIESSQPLLPSVPALVDGTADWKTLAPLLAPLALNLAQIRRSLHEAWPDPVLDEQLRTRDDLRPIFAALAIELLDSDEVKRGQLEVEPLLTAFFRGAARVLVRMDGEHPPTRALLLAGLVFAHWLGERPNETTTYSNEEIERVVAIAEKADPERLVYPLGPLALHASQTLAGKHEVARATLRAAQSVCPNTAWQLDLPLALAEARREDFPSALRHLDRHIAAVDRVQEGLSTFVVEAEDVADGIQASLAVSLATNAFIVQVAHHQGNVVWQVGLGPTTVSRTRSWLKISTSSGESHHWARVRGLLLKAWYQLVEGDDVGVDRTLGALLSQWATSDQDYDFRLMLWVGTVAESRGHLLAREVLRRAYFEASRAGTDSLPMAVKLCDAPGKLDSQALFLLRETECRGSDLLNNAVWELSDLNAIMHRRAIALATETLPSDIWPLLDHPPAPFPAWSKSLYRTFASGDLTGLDSATPADVAQSLRAALADSRGVRSPWPCEFLHGLDEASLTYWPRDEVDAAMDACGSPPMAAKVHHLRAAAKTSTLKEALAASLAELEILAAHPRLGRPEAEPTTLASSSPELRELLLERSVSLIAKQPGDAPGELRRLARLFATEDLESVHSSLRLRAIALAREVADGKKPGEAPAGLRRTARQWHIDDPDIDGLLRAIEEPSKQTRAIAERFYGSFLSQPD